MKLLKIQKAQGCSVFSYSHTKAIITYNNSSKTKIISLGRKLSSRYASIHLIYNLASQRGKHFNDKAFRGVVGRRRASHDFGRRDKRAVGRDGTHNRPGEISGKKPGNIFHKKKREGGSVYKKTNKSWAVEVHFSCYFGTFVDPV